MQEGWELGEEEEQEKRCQQRGVGWILIEEEDDFGTFRKGIFAHS